MIVVNKKLYMADQHVLMILSHSGEDQWPANEVPEHCSQT